MSKKQPLVRLWVRSDSHATLKVAAAKSKKSMSDAFDDLVNDSKKSKDNWGKLF